MLFWTTILIWRIITSTDLDIDTFIRALVGWFPGLLLCLADLEIDTFIRPVVGWFSRSAFQSWREFSYLDEEDMEKADNRDHKVFIEFWLAGAGYSGYFSRCGWPYANINTCPSPPQIKTLQRYLEKKNKAARKKAKTEDNARIIKLVDNAVRCDPRLKMFKVFSFLGNIGTVSFLRSIGFIYLTVRCDPRLKMFKVISLLGSIGTVYLRKLWRLCLWSLPYRAVRSPRLKMFKVFSFFGSFGSSIYESFEVSV